MRILLIDDEPNRRAALEAPLRALHHEIVGPSSSCANLLEAVKRYQPHVILIDIKLPERDTLESLNQVTRATPRPIVLFTGPSPPSMIRQALRAGVTSYIVDGLSRADMQSILDVAVVRFEESMAMRKELEAAKEQLADRRDVEKAKGLIMTRRGVTEQEAHSQLNRMAMVQNLKLGEAARAVIATAEII